MARVRLGVVERFKFDKCLLFLCMGGHDNGWMR